MYLEKIRSSKGCRAYVKENKNKRNKKNIVSTFNILMMRKKIN
jgi:hypothetical protein